MQAASMYMPGGSASLEPNPMTYRDLTCSEVLTEPEFVQIRAERLSQNNPMTCSTQQLIHVEVCQHPNSTMRASLVREYATARLKLQRTAFSGGFVLTDFEDSVLQEHVLSISVSDTPKGLMVHGIKELTNCVPMSILMILLWSNSAH